ncbi:MAG: hypothetical protein IKX24_01980 [Prevotella sp.]|nr:hypothetical protein [Prevotella sp.]MBR5060893.1 hypothetical protein [Prevotella sp.]
MKKTYVTPRTTSVDVLTENAFAVIISKVDGVTDNNSIPYIGFGGSNTSGVDPTAKRGFWDV